MATLQISGMGFPPYSSNHCRQILETIPQGNFVRTLDGTLVFLGNTLNHKYKTLIQGEDINSPTLSMLSSGQRVLVHCIQPLWQEGISNRLVLHRQIAPNTEVYATTLQGDPLEVMEESPQHVKVSGSPLTFPIFIAYYPLLSMLVKSFVMEGGLENQSTKWRLELEEI